MFIDCLCCAVVAPTLISYSINDNNNLLVHVSCFDFLGISSRALQEISSAKCAQKPIHFRCLLEAPLCSRTFYFFALSPRLHRANSDIVFQKVNELPADDAQLR